MGEDNALDHSITKEPKRHRRIPDASGPIPDVPSHKPLPVQHPREYSHQEMPTHKPGLPR